MMRRAVAAVLALGAGCASAPPVQAPAAPDTRLGEIQTSMTELLERLDVLNDRIARLEHAQEEAQSATTSAVPPLVPQPSRRADTAATVPIASAASSAMRGAQLAEQYRSAIMLYGDRRVPEARAAFQAVFDSDPGSELADNALFWIGETYYSAGDWQNAISFYRRVSTEYGDQNKAPDAVYKLAMAYAKTGDLALARQTFQEVIARYPYSTPAASSRRELERIKY